MIRLNDVSKEYRRGLGGLRGDAVRALDGISLELPAGAALGLIGLNGAGKSTLLRVLLGYVRPTRGEVEIDGLAPREWVQRHGAAYVPERVAIPAGWTVRGALEAYAALGELGTETGERVEQALARLGLESLADRRVGTLSKGNQQRLAIAQALLGDRKLMILDEPTDGLDPVWIAELRDIVARWRAADPQRVLIVASHNLPEVERMADQALVLHEGRLRERIPLGAAGEGTLEERFLRLLDRWRREAA